MSKIKLGPKLNYVCQERYFIFMYKYNLKKKDILTYMIENVLN